jgi:polysaccharide deacetylase 2 family uncharacterized protein YibQ
MAGQPKVAVVIDDVGINIPEVEPVIRLPMAVTLSFLPYAQRLKEQTEEATAAGHELLLHMPMQPMGSDNPGPGALLTNLSTEENAARFEKALDSFAGFDGVNNHMGSKFTADAEAMLPVIKALQKRGLFFLDSRTSGRSVGAKIAQEQGLPHISRDIFLDDEIKEDAIKTQFSRAERLAQHQGYVVVIGHPHVLTVKLLTAWLQDIQARGFVLVPLRTLVK